MSTTNAYQSFEQLKQSFLERINLPGVLTGEQLIVSALVTISQQLASLEQGLTGKVSVPPAGGQSVPTNISLTIPLTQKQIDEFIIAAAQVEGQGTSGYETGYITQFAVTVPAATSSGPGTAQVNIAPAPGYVATLIAPAVVTTDDVGAGVSVNLLADGKPAIGPFGFILGPSQSINVAQYLIVKDPATGLQFQFSNPSASQVTVWIYGEAMFIPLSFYQRFTERLLVAGYDIIKQAFGITGV